VDLSFNEFAFKQWMTLEPYFKLPGINDHRVRMAEALGGSPKKMAPLSLLLELFAPWDELSFYGLVQTLCPQFSGDSGLEFVDDDGKIQRNSCDLYETTIQHTN
jgi:hypothetical protein